MKNLAQASIALIAAGFVSSLSLQADTPFISDVGTGGTVFNDGGAGYDDVVGYELEIGSAPISVTALGTFDDGSSTGVTSDMLVGVWNSAGTLLGSVEVTPGAGDLSGDFSYASLGTPLTLQANTDYYFGSRSDSDYSYTEEVLRNSTDVVSSSVATYVSYGNKSTTDLPEDFANEVPNQPLGDTSPIMGPNFQFQVLPEPSTYAMMTGGLLLLGLCLHRRNAIRARN